MSDESQTTRARTTGVKGSIAILAALGLCVAAVIVLGDGSVVLVLALFAVLGALYAMAKLSLRTSCLVLLFLGLTLENPPDQPAVGLWRSPLYIVGALMLAHLNLTIPVKALIFSGVDLILLYLAGIHLCRSIKGARVDAPGFVETPRAQIAAALLCVGSAAWVWIYGMASGGEFAPSLWQVQRVIYLPLVFLLFQAAFPGPPGHGALARTVVLAACVKALVAVYVRATVLPLPPASELPYATVHADSMLFAAVFCMFLIQLWERPNRHSLLWALLVLPILVAGMIANNRRLVWVEVAVALIVMFALTPRTRAKRKVTRTLLALVPVFALYIGIGWTATSSVFKPVQVMRSVVDSTSDKSTEWRDWENYNLFFTLRQNPLLGTGYGHPYVEKVRLPDISQAYALYRHIPHNSILGLWAYCGFVGFTGLWTLIVVGIFFAVRAYRGARNADDRIAALSAFSAILVYVVHCYGDMGLGTWTSVFLVGAALTVGPKLAVANGAWPA